MFNDSSGLHNGASDEEEGEGERGKRGGRRLEGEGEVAAQGEESESDGEVSRLCVFVGMS